MAAAGRGDRDTRQQGLTIGGWNEEDLDKILRYPCYAFQRGNIIFTTTPPPPAVPKEADGRGRSSSVSGGEGGLRAADEVADFCEVCRGIRSPNFARRAAPTYTTHFCTRVPAKRQTSAGTEQRSKSTGSAGSGLTARDVGDKTQGHISRLSTFLRSRFSAQKFFSSESDSATTTTSSVFSESRSDLGLLAPASHTPHGSGGSGCHTCVGGTEAVWRRRTKGGSASGSIASSGPFRYSTCSSSYPLSTTTASSSLAGCDVSTCCGCSSASSCAANSSFERVPVWPESGSGSGSGCSFGAGDWALRQRILRNMKATRARRRAFSSSNDDDLGGTSSSDESEPEDGTSGGSSEMGWSFGSFYEAESRGGGGGRRLAAERRRPMSAGPGEPLDAVTPFVANAGRQLDVLEKFGSIVGTLRRPGHHVGPSKNAECLCHSCRAYFSDKS